MGILGNFLGQTSKKPADKAGVLPSFDSIKYKKIGESELGKLSRCLSYEHRQKIIKDYVKPLGTRRISFGQLAKKVKEDLGDNIHKKFVEAGKKHYQPPMVSEKKKISPYLMARDRDGIKVENHFSGAANPRRSSFPPQTLKGGDGAFARAAKVTPESERRRLGLSGPGKNGFASQGNSNSGGGFEKRPL